MKNRISYLCASTLVLLALVGCKHKTGDGDSDTTQKHPMKVVIEGFTDTVQLELVPMDDAEARYREAKKKITYKNPDFSTKPAAPRPVAAAKAPAPKAKSETIYVETDGAQGRVWGHVTMKGDRGTGTIHDWDENTLTVTVTRHGNELFAVDQNSRQYIFKLKN